MEHIVNEIHRLLIKSHKAIAVAESCTGGLLSNLLTKLPGSSKYFTLGVIAYSNEAKNTLLNIPKSIIAQKGAVSKEAAKSMASSIRKLARTDFGIGITGIAGPTGSSKTKPVGTVFIALDSENRSICKKFHFKGSRLAIKKKTALQALHLLKSYL